MCDVSNDRICRKTTRADFAVTYRYKQVSFNTTMTEGRRSQNNNWTGVTFYNQELTSSRQDIL